MVVLMENGYCPAYGEGIVVFRIEHRLQNARSNAGGINKSGLHGTIRVFAPSSDGVLAHVGGHSSGDGLARSHRRAKRPGGQ